jgi:uncharacterized phosphosugar-binding protein
VTDSPSPGRAYLGTIGALVDRLSGDQWPHITAAAALIADALASGRDVHAFGSGHSHMLAEELFYRAGGLVRVRPILDERLMLHVDAARSTVLERQPEMADEILASHPMRAGDVLVVASNSGGNAVAVRLVQLVQPMGVRVIALTSLRHAISEIARASGVPRLHELADVVIDNGGQIGDAAVGISGFDRKVAPTSTVIGAAILNAIVAEAVQLLVDRGAPVEVFASSNLEGGDEINEALMRAAVAR